MTSRPRTRLLIVTLAAELVAVDVILPGLLRTPSPGRALPLRRPRRPRGARAAPGLRHRHHGQPDPATHDSYYPVPDGPGGHPALLTYQPAP